MKTKNAPVKSPVKFTPVLTQGQDTPQNSLWRWSTIQLHNPERFQLLDSRGICFARVEFLCNEEFLEPVAARIAAAPELLALAEMVVKFTGHQADGNMTPITNDELYQMAFLAI